MLQVWSDREITGGLNWDDEIGKRLRECQIFIALTSAAFYNSEYIRGVEMQAALRRHQEGLCRIVPIMLRSWRPPQELRALQFLPGLDQDVASAPDRDRVLTGIAGSIERIVAEMAAGKWGAPPPPAPPPAPSIVRPDPLQRVAPEDGNWVVIPGGTFWMGAQSSDPAAPNHDPRAEAAESPVHQVTLSSFRMRRFPVTVEEFQRFVTAGGYRAREHWGAGGYGDFREPEDWAAQQKRRDHPVTGVSWYESAAYCCWAGGRLPTEAEWERAARGPHGWRFPWGNEPPLDPAFANYGSKAGGTTPVGQYPKGNSSEGLYDLLGNVWEWCSDRYGAYAAAAGSDPQGPAEGTHRILRGGSWYSNPQIVRVSFRGRGGPTNRSSLVGLRCAGELSL